MLFSPKHFLLLALLLSEFVIARPAVEIIVKVAPEVRFNRLSQNQLVPLDEALQKTLEAAGVKALQPVFSAALVKQTDFVAPYFKFTLMDSAAVDKLLDALDRSPAVVFAEVNHAYRIHFTPSDSLFPRQWALQTIRAPEAWEISRGDPGVIVGVIDTGVDYFHPDLQGQIWVNAAEDLNGNGRLDGGDLNGIDDDGNGYVDDVIGWDFTDAPAFPDGGDYLTPDNDPRDEYPGGHGTAVAGIIAAATDNITGIAGIAPDSRVMVLRAGTSSGFLEEDDVAEAILYAVHNGARIINLSFGDVVYSHLLKDAVDYGVKMGAIFVASSGNVGNEEFQYPAAYDETISVGAIDSLENVAGFSSYGSKLDLVAPGKDILTLQRENKYGWVTGTSFSAPMVSAALALLWAKEPGLSAEGLTARLLANCRKKGFNQWNPFYGNGILDLPAILQNYSTHYAHLTFPATYQGTHASEIPVIGTAAGSDFYQFELRFGVGTNPTSFRRLHRGFTRHLNDTLFVWDVSELPDTTYTLELDVFSREMDAAVHRVVFTLDRTPPQVSAWKVVPLAIEKERGYLLQFVSDDLTRASLLLQPQEDGAGEPRFFSNYLAHQHTFVLSQETLNGQYSFTCRLENNVGLATEFAPPTAPVLDFSHRLEFSQFFETAAAFPGKGYFFGRPLDLNRDGQAEVLGYAVLPDLASAQLCALQFRGNELETACAPIPAFPRDVTDLNGDGYPEVLAGYGNVTYLIPGGPGVPLQNDPIPIQMDDFWGARLLDFGGDGRYKILAIHGNQWGIYRLDDWRNGQVSLLQMLENPSPGQNAYGVPFAEIADFDRDGRMEIVYGDYDGDLIFWEQDSEGLFRVKYSRRLDGTDATNHFRAGDFDGDGAPELAVASKYLVEHQSESSLNQQYWILSVLKAEGDNNFREVWRFNVHGVVDQHGVESGIAVADFDDDGQEDLFFTPFPQGYLIGYQEGEYRVKGYLDRVNANTVLKLPDGRVFVPTDSLLILLDGQSVAERPAPPLSYRVLSADTNHISLSWREVPGNNGYRVERTDVPAGSLTVFTVQKNVLNDSTVEAGQTYFYRIFTLDSSLANPLSVPLSTRVLRAELPPVLRRIVPVSNKQLRLQFSGPLGHKAFRVDGYRVEPEHYRPISALRGEGNRQVLLTFQHPLSGGDHELRLQGLESEQGVPLYPDTTGFFFTTFSDPRPPYVRSVEMLSKKELKIVFSEAMEPASCQEVKNYRIIPRETVLSAHQDPYSPEVVYLELSGQNRMGSLGENYYLEIGEVKNQTGLTLSPLQRRFLIFRLVTNLEHIVVFPNPFRPRGGLNEITFGNVPKDCEITIFTASGRRVTSLVATGNSGGIKWDLKNDFGEAVRSGIYLFLASYRGQQKTGKFVILK